MSLVIRFGYCPPNPGPKTKTKCKWYNNIDDAIEAYCNLNYKMPIYISYNNCKYREISYEQLIEIFNYESMQSKHL